VVVNGRWNNVHSNRVLLKERAYEELKKLIIDETFPPGTFLSERQLSETLQMSKTPIRAALERLEMDGFVSVAPQQGILVRELSIDEVVDLFDIRRVLETFVVRQLTGRLTPDQVRQLEANLKAQKRFAEREDLTNYTRLDADFHRMLCRFHGNKEIEKVILPLRDKMFQVVARVSRTPGRSITSYNEHVSILDAIVQGDGELAATRMEEHLLYGKQFLVSR
jgi:DNA-binding GntR family transcriptional regulator